MFASDQLDRRQMFEKSYGPKWGRRRCAAFVAIVVVAFAVIAVGQTDDSKDNITGTVSKAEPTTKQDGAPAHPLCGRQPMPAQHRSRHVAEGWLDPAHSSRDISLFRGGSLF
jgi:hypothetical protein